MSAAVDTPAVVALNEALRLAEHGYKLTPVTITRAANGKKQPRFHQGWRHESAWSNDPDQIRAWWADHMDTSFAIGCGVNGIEGVDLDVKPELGIDAVTVWAQHGLPISNLTQATPSGGVHSIWRVRADGLALPQEAGRSLGKGIDTRNRAGLFFAAGAYILGEEDHGHYRITGELPRLLELEETPLEVVELFAEHAAAERAQRPANGGVAVHDERWQREQTGLALLAIRSHDRAAGGYRAKLQHAGLFYGRAVEQGFLTEGEAEAKILEAHRSVWGAEVWPENLKDIRDAIKDGPALERWRIPVDPGPRNNGSTASTSTNTISAPAGSPSFFFADEPDEEGEPDGDAAGFSAPTPPAPALGIVSESPVRPMDDEAAPEGMSDEEAAQYLEFRRQLNEEKRKLRLRRQAAAELTAEDREPLTVLDADDFLNSPLPDYLVPKMLYRDGLAVVFGAPGAAKSFLVLDIALSLATGTPWRGRHLGRGRVHYVMAEGQMTNVLRTRAWLHHRDVDPAELRDWFRAVPVAVMLTEPGIVDYLPVVARDQPDMIILDTKNLMYAGKESQGDDYGAMLRVLHTLRRAAGGAAVVLVDHSGLTDDTRVRGSNAQKGGVETEIRVAHENGVRRAEVTRDKSGSDGAEWLYRLQQVPEVPRPPDVDAPAVCVPLERSEVAEASPFGMLEDWNDPAQPELPVDVIAYGGPGKSAIKPLARFMRYSASSGVGFSLAAARKAVRAKYVDERGKPKWSEDTVDRAWGALCDLGRLEVAETGGSTARSHWISRPEDPQ